MDGIVGDGIGLEWMDVVFIVYYFYVVIDRILCGLVVGVS